MKRVILVAIKTKYGYDLDVFDSFESVKTLPQEDLQNITETCFCFLRNLEANILKLKKKLKIDPAKPHISVRFSKGKWYVVTPSFTVGSGDTLEEAKVDAQNEFNCM